MNKDDTRYEEMLRHCQTYTIGGDVDSYKQQSFDTPTTIFTMTYDEFVKFYNLEETANNEILELFGGELMLEEEEISKYG